MEPPDPSFADEFNVPQRYTVLVFGVRRAAVSLPFQVHRLKALVEAGLVAFLSARFEFGDEVPKEAQHGSLAHLHKFISSHLHGLSKVAVADNIWTNQKKIENVLSMNRHTTVATSQWGGGQMELY